MSTITEEQFRRGAVGICADCGEVYGVGESGLVKVSPEQESSLPLQTQLAIRRDRALWRKIHIRDGSPGLN